PRVLHRIPLLSAGSFSAIRRRRNCGAGIICILSAKHVFPFVRRLCRKGKMIFNNIRLIASFEASLPYATVHGPLHRPEGVDAAMFFAAVGPLVNSQNVWTTPYDTCALKYKCGGNNHDKEKRL
ncbi:MAG: hypothetical protein IKS27_02695, partial [Oscillospiraceae bacterium]|nr:hypothetical protein [Oscillospiraceae bacterium]